MIEKKIKVLFLLAPATGGIHTYVLSILSEIDRFMFEPYIALPLDGYHRFSDVRVEYFPVDFSSTYRIIKTIISLAVFVLKRKIDIIHSQGFRASIVGYIISKTTGVKTISTIHTFLFSPAWRKRKAKFYKLIARFFLNRIDKIIVPCNAIFQELVDIGVRKDKIITIYNGVSLPELEIFFTQDEVYCRKDEFVIGCISRFAPQKGVEYFVMSIPEILSKYPFFKFLLVGEGPEIEKIQKLISLLKIEDNIQVLPFQQEIDKILKIIDILIIPSISEGLPYLMLEALAHKKVVVATEVGGIPEVIKHMENGYLIPPHNHRAISSAVVCLFENKEKMEQFSSCGRETIEKHFTKKMMVRKTENVIRELVS